MNYHIESKEPHDMRYDTAGDYYLNGNVTKIEVMRQVSEDYEFCIMIHELIEEYLTKKRGITEAEITKFDLQFEMERREGFQSQESEPGFDSRAPYKKEHAFADFVEKMIAIELGVDWNKYNEEIRWKR